MENNGRRKREESGIGREVSLLRVPPPSHAADCDPLRLVLCLPAAANRAEVRDGFRPKDFSPLRRPKSWNSRAEFLFLQDRGCGVFPHPQYEKEESIWHI